MKPAARHRNQLWYWEQTRNNNMDNADRPKCQLCGEPMPLGEEMFNYHGYSGPCPKPPLPKKELAFKVTAKCENGHEQFVTYYDMTREQVEVIIGLVDGTSPLYIYPPGENSVIGKCAYPNCGKPFKCSIQEIQEVKE